MHSIVIEPIADHVRNDLAKEYTNCKKHRGVRATERAMTSQRCVTILVYISIVVVVVRATVLTLDFQLTHRNPIHSKCARFFSCVLIWI